MVRAAFVDKNGVRKGTWSEDEDAKLRAHVLHHGHSNWRLLPRFAGLNRCGKSCRLRWMNYLKPDLKHGDYSREEAELIKKLHDQLGNKWSAIAARLPGRTDNEVKNFWHTHFNHKKRSKRSSTKSTVQDTVPGMDQSGKNSEMLEFPIQEISEAPSGLCIFESLPTGSSSRVSATDHEQIQSELLPKHWDSFGFELEECKSIEDAACSSMSGFLEDSFWNDELSFEVDTSYYVQELDFCDFPDGYGQFSPDFYDDAIDLF